MTGTTDQPIDKVAWIHISDGKVLSTRSHGKEAYYFPGGKREPGESDLDTLQREIREELTVDLDLSTAQYYGTSESQAHGHAPGVQVRLTTPTRLRPAPSTRRDPPLATHPT